MQNSKTIKKIICLSHTHYFLLSLFVFFCFFYFFTPCHSFTFLSFFHAANELTVGKVYAALMIFDYLKQTRAQRRQMQQQKQKEEAAAAGNQVRHPTQP